MILTSIYAGYSRERKEMQRKGEAPAFFTTGGYQLFKDKYEWDGLTLRETYMRIAKTAARHMPDPDQWAVRFFDLMWKGWLAPSTPVFANMGTKRGMPVSCSGGVVYDSISGFYSSRSEAAMLTKEGFGTSSYLGDIRPRGSSISTGGRAAGVMPVIKGFIQDMEDVAQGGDTRRGAWAGYIELSHGDFWEIVTYLNDSPDGFNMGWLMTDEIYEALENGDEEMNARWQRAMKVKAVHGKGYFLNIDNINRNRPVMYKDKGLFVKASNLCIEIALFSDADHTFTCVLSSMNAALYNEWKDTDAVYVATVFLDCVVSEFLELAKEIPELEKAVRFTEKGRALGLGLLGFHTYLQQEMIPMESFDAHMKNIEIFTLLEDESLKATMWMSKTLGEPEWCEGYGVRNTHRIAVAPNTSSALLCGGVSQGIEPVVANVFTQLTAAGEIYRMNPVFLQMLRDNNIEWTDVMAADVIDKVGSVQHVDYLTDEQKAVLKTAHEMDQMALVRLACARAPKICQSQSLNLFFVADESEEYIQKVHQEALTHPDMMGLYYLRTLAGVQSAKDECVACGS